MKITLALAMNLQAVLFRLKDRSVGDIEIGNAYNSVSAYTANYSQDGGINVVCTYRISERAFGLPKPSLSFDDEDNVLVPGKYEYEGRANIVVYNSSLPTVETLSDIALRYYNLRQEPLELLDGEKVVVPETSDYQFPVWYELEKCFASITGQGTTGDKQTLYYSTVALDIAFSENILEKE